MGVSDTSMEMELYLHRPRYYLASNFALARVRPRQLSKIINMQIYVVNDSEEWRLINAQTYIAAVMEHICLQRALVLRHDLLLMC